MVLIPGFLNERKLTFYKHRKAAKTLKVKINQLRIFIHHFLENPYGLKIGCLMGGVIQKSRTQMVSTVLKF